MSRGFRFNPVKILAEFGQDKYVMNYLGINLRLYLDKSPVENYRNSRGV